MFLQDLRSVAKQQRDNNKRILKDIQKGQAIVSEIEKKLLDYSNALFLLDKKFSIQKIQLGLFIIDTRKAKEELKKAIVLLQDEIKNALFEHSIQQVKQVDKESEQVFKVIKKVPDNLEELDEITQFVEKELDMRKQFIIEQIIQIKSKFMTLEKGKFLVPSQDRFEYLSCLQLPKQIEDEQLKCNELMKIKKNEFATQLEEEHEQLLNEIDSIKQQFQPCKKYEKIENHNQHSSEFSELKERIEKCIIMSSKINSREYLLGRKSTNYKELFMLQKEFTPYCKLWLLCTNFYMKSPEWYNGFISNIDRDELKQEITEALSNLHKLEKSNFRNAPKPLSVTLQLKKKFESFKPYVPIIYDLKNPGMKEHHIKDLEDTTSINFSQLQIPLQSLIDKGIMKYKDYISELAEKASREQSLLNALKKMKEEWQCINFTVQPFRDTGSYVIKNTDAIFEIIDDHILKTTSILNSQYVESLKNDVNKWKQNLVKIQEILDE